MSAVEGADVGREKEKFALADQSRKGRASEQCEYYFLFSRRNKLIIDELPSRSYVLQNLT